MSVFCFVLATAKESCMTTPEPGGTKVESSKVVLLEVVYIFLCKPSVVLKCNQIEGGKCVSL